jgi:hypothetical protein
MNNIIVNMSDNDLERVLAALERIPKETLDDVLSMADSMTCEETVQKFNNQAKDTFVLLERIATMCNKYEECNIVGNKKLFDHAVKQNADLAVNKFTLVILEYAPEIYAADHECFLKMSIPESELKVADGFSLVKTTMFKEMWVQLSNDFQSEIIDNMILLTMYAHAYLYKTLLK